MLTITDAASETMNRLDMTNPFLRLVNKLSLWKAQPADYAKTIMGGRFIIGLISMQDFRQPSLKIDDGGGSRIGRSVISSNAKLNTLRRRDDSSQ